MKMGSSRSLLFFILPIMILGFLSPAIAEDDVNNGVCTLTADYCWSCSNTNNASIYKENLNNLLSTFSSNKSQINSGFYNSSQGQGQNKVNAIALCRGDLELKDCQTCFSASVSILLQNCTNRKEAIIWAERCTVRYSNDSIFGVEKDEPVKYLPSPQNATNAEEFKLVLNPLMENLSGKAAAGNSSLKFAAGHALVTGTSQTIYATAQCTPDLDKQDCSSCLNESISDIPKQLEGKEGGRVLRPSCMLRFENNIFYEATADSLINLPGKQGNNTSNITTKASPSSFFGLLLSLLFSSALIAFF